jgi:hypothetical protein
MHPYCKLLARKLFGRHNRILAFQFRNKPLEPRNILAELDAASIQAKPAKKGRYIPWV